MYHYHSYVFDPCQLSKNICSRHEKFSTSLKLRKLSIKARKMRVSVNLQIGFLICFDFSPYHRKSIHLILSCLMVRDALKRKYNTSFFQCHFNGFVSKVSSVLQKLVFSQRNNIQAKYIPFLLSPFKSYLEY